MTIWLWVGGTHHVTEPELIAVSQAVRGCIAEKYPHEEVRMTRIPPDRSDYFAGMRTPQRGVLILLSASTQLAEELEARRPNLIRELRHLELFWHQQLSLVVEPL